jgi:hypothetical protein
VDEKTGERFVREVNVAGNDEKNYSVRLTPTRYQWLLEHRE